MIFFFSRFLQFDKKHPFKFPKFPTSFQYFWETYKSKITVPNCTTSRLQLRQLSQCTNVLALNQVIQLALQTRPILSVSYGVLFSPLGNCSQQWICLSPNNNNKQLLACFHPPAKQPIVNPFLSLKWDRIAHQMTEQSTILGIRAVGT